MRTTPAIPGKPMAAPPPLELAVSLTGEDRLAGMQHLYRDLIAAQRRRILIYAGIAMFLTALGPVSVAWSQGGRGNPGLLWRGFVDSLTGPTGMFLAAFALIGGLAFLLHGRMLHSRQRRWLRRENLEAPTPCEYRLHEGGLDSSEPHHRSHIPAWRLHRLVDAPGHAFIEVEGSDDLVALPKRALSPEQQAHLADWASFCIGQSPPPEDDAPLRPPEASAEGPSLELRFHLTPEDRTAAILRQQERLWPRGRRLRRTGLGLVVALLLVPAVMLFLWGIDPDRVPLAFALPLFGEMLAKTFWPVTVGLCILVIASAFMNRWALRQQAKNLGKVLHQRVRDEAFDVVIAKDGMTGRQRGLVNRYDWAAFTGIERRGEHLFLVRRRGDPLLLPARVLNSDQMRLFDRLAESHIGGGQA
jgi:membrane protein implicated in regulation of membrane protease activity